MLSSHLKSLLKKNLLISKSTFILTLIEILSPILIMLGLLGLKSLFKIENLEIQEDINYVVNNASYLEAKVKHHVENEVAYRGSIYMCNERNVVAFVGKNFPEKLAEVFIKHKWERTDVEFKYYDDVETLYKYVESKNYGVNEGKICFAVSYKKEENKYTYKLHYVASTLDKKNPPEIPPTDIGVGDRLNKQPDFGAYLKYTQSGFFMIQKFFYDFVLQQETGINIYRIVKEKETKAKEGMKIMGLSELTYFLSNFITYFVKNIIYSIFITLILSYTLKGIESIYIFIIYFLFGLVIFALVFFFQSFLERTIISIIVSLLIYALMYFFFIVVYQNSVNIFAKYILCILFPPTTLQLGINTISTFETNFQDFNGRINYKYNNFSVVNMYIFLTINFLLYLFFGFFFQNVLPHEYGIRQPIYFLFTSSFWGLDKDYNNFKFEEKNINNIEGNEINNKNEKCCNEIIINIKDEKNTEYNDQNKKDNTLENSKNNKQIRLDELKVI